MVFGACIFFTVAEPTGLNPLEIAANIVSFVIFKTKRGGPEILSIT